MEKSEHIDVYGEDVKYKKGCYQQSTAGALSLEEARLQKNTKNSTKYRIGTIGMKN